MKKKVIALLLLLPCALIMIFSVFLPIITTFGYSLKYFKLTEPNDERIIGFTNYKNVITSSEFHNALLNSIVILLAVLVIGLVISFVIALVLNKKTKLTTFLTAIVIIPWALPPIVNGIMWKFIFFPGYGLMNQILLKLGLVNVPISWITNRPLFLLVIAIVVSWRIIPFSAIVILANLQNISKDYYEAFNLEGGSKWQAFKYITLPLLVPSIGVVLINLTTTAVNVFDEIISISGFQFENQTLMVYNYSHTFNFLDFGLGSTISYVIMLLTGVFGYLYVRNMTVEKVY
ncbi:MAG: sugar ABC transporter permease [Tissierellia bacterium]|nr:sugar ABC transporter permease [Tissierellia bacterium]